uniref:C-type lectin domain family 4 member A-like n=1 Tax=Centroberyx gerrardi TaxID=166262 RepID=UPI003AAF3849
MRNQQEKEEILKVTDLESYWWIGLFRDSWKWSDQSNSPFRRWSNGEPGSGDEFCAIHNKRTAAWHDVPCDTKFWFICSVPMLKVLKVELIAEGSVDLNDPARQEAILEQMEKHMRDQGIHQFRLRWRKQPDGEIFHEKKEEQKP